MPCPFGTKAETLKNLEHKIKTAKVLPQLCLTVEEWNYDQLKIINSASSRGWLKIPLIVRSSGLSEDSLQESFAGHFLSVSNVEGEKELKEAILKVIESFDDQNPQNQVFIQPMLSDVILSGVALTRDPSSGGHYYIASYDDHSGKTDTVTSGTSNDVSTFYYAKSSVCQLSGWKGRILQLLRELESLLEHDALDIEFAIDSKDDLFLFQVRPLIISERQGTVIEEQKATICQIMTRFSELSKPHPYLCGTRSVFGVMPDWNPAEIIGIRPRPLALSLYKELITNHIWAYQRDNYGYRNLRSFPLLISFAGLPYIDVRVSFNSFIPADLEDEIAERLVEYYIKCLINNPNHHDKVEFEIIYSCYTLDLLQRLEKLKDSGFSEKECQVLADSLRILTNNIINDKCGLWKNDIKKIEELELRQKAIEHNSLNCLDRIYWLLEDCKRYGTLPFAGLARAAFIAVQILRSFVTVGILTEEDYFSFMNSLNTISTEMNEDFLTQDRESFIRKYGHLRPGMYDILSPRYDKMPDLYFNWNERIRKDAYRNANNFGFSLSKLNKLERKLLEHGLEHNVVSIFNFIKGAIEGREYAKYVFAKSLSDVMELLSKIGLQAGFTTEDISYLDISVIKQLYSSSSSLIESLQQSIQAGKKAYRITKSMCLPPLITTEDDVVYFILQQNIPNFVTQKSIIGRIVFKDDAYDRLNGNILFVEAADPGYDWIFTHNIGGFVTMYGGINSHMAIRAMELDIPAVIGAGEVLFRRWSKAKLLKIDCINQQVQILQ